MNSRIIWIFKNSEHSAVAPRSVLRAGAAHAARPPSSPTGRAAPSTRHCPPPVHRWRQLAARDGAASFIATSGMTPDAVAPADQGCRDEHTRPELTAAPGGAPCPTKSSPGDFLETVQDVVTVVSGMLVFGGIAFFLLVLA